MIVEIQRKSHVQMMTYQDFEERIRDGEVDPKTMVRFEVITGDAFRPVGELELYQSLADPQRQAFRRNMMRRGVPIVTALLVGVQIRIYLMSWLGGQEEWLKYSFYNWAPAIIEQGQVYRLLTYGLLHTSFTHMLFNLYFLTYTGYHLERAMGRANLLLLYFGSVFSGGLLSMMMAPDRPSLGASCGVFGLLAAVIILGWKHWENLPRQSRKYFGWALAPYLGFSILSGLSADNVDNWGHIGGLMGGVALMTILDPELLPDQREANIRTRRIVVLLLLLTTIGLTTAGTRLLSLTRYSDEHGWNVQRPDPWREGWAFTGDRGWFSPTMLANVSIATTVHPRPINIEEAARNLEQRIASGGKNLQRISWDPRVVEDCNGMLMTLRFELSGQPQEVSALVLVRGVYEHRVQVQSLASNARNYDVLIERIMDSATLNEPKGLDDARRRARFHSQSWEPALEMGEALYQIGFYNEAISHYERAVMIEPSDSRSLEGLLRVYADYDVSGGQELAMAALEDHRDSLKVVEAAADVLYKEGLPSEAIAALDEAWASYPENAVLRRIRLQRGLSVDVSAPDPVP